MTPTNNLKELSASAKDQYTLWQILGIWTSVALSMGLVYWVITPILLSRGNVNPFTYLFLINVCLVWQGVVAYILLRREVKPFTWEGVKNRLWLYTPSNPKTGIRSKWLYLWTIPLSVLAFFAFPNLGWLNELWAKTFPFLAPRPYAEIQNLAGPAVEQWWLLGVLAGAARVQVPAGRGIDLPGNLAAQNERRVREVGLSRQSHSVHGIPSTLPLDNTVTAPLQLDLCLVDKTVQVVLDGSHHSRV
jgi:hypothetical protein